MTLRHLDLFSGIGGFALAAKWAGFKTIGFCEIEDFPKRVLKKNFPGVRIHDDIREVDGNQYRGVELITGGYPCQPFSVAGKRKGHEDDRHLWPEMFRIIAQARPVAVVSENVTGHISMGLDDVLSEMDSLGYTSRPVIVPAAGVGARHIRDRVWIISYASGSGRQQKSNGAPGDESSNERRAKEGDYQSSGMVEAPRGQEFWATEPGIHKLANGISARLVRDMNKALGNAIVPQVAHRVISSMKETILMTKQSQHAATNASESTS